MAERTLEQVSSEYGKAATELGDLKYRIETFEMEAAERVTLMRALNQEAFKLKQAASEAKEAPKLQAVPEAKSIEGHSDQIETPVAEVLNA